MNPQFEADLNHILEQGRTDFEALRGGRVFITGATGFFGKWILSALVAANQRYHLNIEILALSRNPTQFTQQFPHLGGTPGKNSGLSWLQGDIVNFKLPDGDWPWVLHAATPTDLRLYQSQPLKMVDEIYAGTTRLMDALASANCKRLLFTSSGAVYGKFPDAMTHVQESYRGAPQPGEPGSAYGESKRIAEVRFALQAQQLGYQLLIARCFAFVGPFLPWDWHFAVGNFLRDAMESDRIRVGGDGTPYRSYLYPTDLVLWLLRIWTQGENAQPYHVGAQREVSIKDLAELIAERAHRHWGRPKISVEIAKEPNPAVAPAYYVPSIAFTKSSLKLRDEFSLEEALDRTVSYYQHSQLSSSSS